MCVSPARELACKDLDHNDQAYIPAELESYDTPITRSPAQELACKDLAPQWPRPTFQLNWGSPMILL
ncbi:alpha-galactosidase [Lacticaseibacillus rhamnosus]|nr:alpha-galactosidase [Lacticaseibacillus rhamnosus]